MSLENRARGQVGGSMAQAAGSAAAKLLYAKSHRLATEEEINAIRRGRRTWSDTSPSSGCATGE